MVKNAIQEYLSGRNLHNLNIIEKDIETVTRIIKQKVQKYESTNNGIGLRIIKAEIAALEKLLRELQSNYIIRQNIQPESLIEDIADDEDVNTPQMVKLIIKTYLNLQAEENNRKRKQLLVGFRISAAKDMIRYSQNKMSEHEADRIATGLASLYFGTEETSNSRKYKERKFLSAPFGGYIK